MVEPNERRKGLGEANEAETRQWDNGRRSEMRSATFNVQPPSHFFLDYDGRGWSDLFHKTYTKTELGIPVLLLLKALLQ
jgi:hypothetical protein